MDIKIKEKIEKIQKKIKKLKDKIKELKKKAKERLKKKKRVRSFKCDICEVVKKDVKARECPMTLKYDGIKDTTYMCDKCYDEAINDEDERLP